MGIRAVAAAGLVAALLASAGCADVDAAGPARDATPADAGASGTAPAPADGAASGTTRRPPVDAKPLDLTGLPVFSGPGDFYQVPVPLPKGRPGDLIRVQPAPDIELEDADVLRVMYHSSNRLERDRAVTGIIAVPRTPAPPEGRPVVSWAHGTTGIGPTCAPSRYPNDQTLGQQLVDDGYVWVATDYDGLGPPGQRHAYLSGVTLGMDVVDIVRAVRQIPGAKAGPRWVAYGHSEGGQAALFAGQIAATWAPDLELVGIVSTAPASALPLLAGLETPASRSYVVMLAAGMVTDYPDLRTDAVLTDLAMSRLSVVDKGCGVDVAVAYQDLDASQVVRPDAINTEPFHSILINTVSGQTKVEAPLLLVHGGKDATIPPSTSEEIVDRLCPKGQVLQRRVYPQADHGGVVAASTPDVEAWIDDRFAGHRARSDC